jgi:hypothetical protein
MIVPADILMLIHFLWIVFMVIGLPLGFLLRSPTLRWLHFGGMLVTALIAAAGMYCPLTTWEEALRWGSDPGSSYNGSFLAHYISKVLYPDLGPGTLRAATVFWGLVTVGFMFWLPPRRQLSGKSAEEADSP